MGYHLGVDVGTTYTAAAVARHGHVEAVTLGRRSVSVPSVVALAEDGLLVGEPAARRALTDPERVARQFKRRVGDPTPLLLGGSPVSAELCMARMVEWVVAQVSATEGEAPASLALTHPANWGEYKLDLLRQALRHVGVTADRFVPEPVAAATAYAAQRPLSPGTVVAVYDLGGGTFDAALVRAGADGSEIVGRPDGIERLGGIDFDHAVFRHVVDAIGLDLDGVDGDDPGTATALARLRAECVEAKEALSHEIDVSVAVMLPERHTAVRLTRAELEAMIRPAVAETVVALRRAVTSAAVPVDQVSTVLLVGGSSRIPLVGQMVTAELGVPVAVDARPKDAICIGAALALAAPPPAAPGGAAGGRPPSPGVVPLAASAAPPGAPSTPPVDSPGAAPPALAGPPAPPAAPAHVAASALPADAGGHPLPGSGGPLPVGASTTGGVRTVVVGVLSLVILVAVVAGVVLLADDRGAPAAGERTATTVGDDPDADPDADRGDRAGTSTTAAGDPDPAGDTLPPLPGDDWSDDARAQFVGDCGTRLATEAAMAGLDPDGLCGCIYDDAAATQDFGEFNEMWSSDDFDPATPLGQWFTGAILDCTMASVG